MPKYPVLGYIKHNGESYEYGDVIELTAKEAKPLSELGSIGKAMKDEAKGSKTGQNDPPNS